jgi:YVTN family beta-propeller protein
MQSNSYHDRRPAWWLAVLLASLGAVCCAAAADSSRYHLLKSVTLGGSDGWDYITVDPGTNRLFITRGSHVMVVDAASGALVGDISGLQRVHGVALAGDRAYISDGGANSVVVIDRHSLRKLAAINVPKGPDGILYDAFSGRVFAFDGGSEDATAIDAATGRVVGKVPLGGKPEAAAADGHGTIFVNIENTSEVAAFDSTRLQVLRRWPLGPCTEPSGMAIDPAHQRIFSGCRNSLMAVSDTQAGKVITTIPIGAGVDSNRFDPGDGLVFSSNGGSGTLTVVRELTPNDYRVLGNVPTMRSARTMELNAATHQVYLVGAGLKAAAATASDPHPRPAIIPGTFRLLILGR